MATTENSSGLCSAPWDTTLTNMVDMLPYATFQYDDSLTDSQNAFWDLSYPADEGLGRQGQGQDHTIQKTFGEISPCPDDDSVIMPQQMGSAQDNGIDLSASAADVDLYEQAGYETAGSSLNGGNMSSLALGSSASSSRKRKGPSTSDTPVSEHSHHSSSAKSNKTGRDRERNRVAAAKCRQKSKRSVSELQKRERELLQHNRYLKAAAGFLRDEVLDLKNEILRHSQCDSDVIHNYIKKAAQEIG